MNANDIQLATPRCHHIIIPKPGGWHRTCYQPMRYRTTDSTWVCTIGHEEPASATAARIHDIL
jgi:hypothetical protein